MENNEIKSYLAKSSKRAAIISIVGGGIVIASLIFSFFSLKEKSNQLDREIAEKQKQTAELDQKFEEKQQKLNETLKSLEETQQTLDDFKTNVREISPNVAEEAVKQTIEKSPQAKQVFQEIKKNEKNDTQPIVRKKINDPGIAKAKEREGFQHLIAGDYDNAIAAFQAAENAYNTYHNVYDIARILRQNKSQMSDPVKKKEIFKKIVKDYSYGAPPDLWQQVKIIANQ